jgi:hypothetical protein
MDISLTFAGNQTTIPHDDGIVICWLIPDLIHSSLRQNRTMDNLQNVNHWNQFHGLPVSSLVTMLTELSFSLVAIYFASTLFYTTETWSCALRKKRRLRIFGHDSGRNAL